MSFADQLLADLEDDFMDEDDVQLDTIVDDPMSDSGQMVETKLYSSVRSLTKLNNDNLKRIMSDIGLRQQDSGKCFQLFIFFF